MKLLDTTFLIDLLNGKIVLNKVEELEKNFKLFTTELNAFELFVGVFFLEQRKQKELMEKAAELLGRLEILNLDRKASMKAAEISANLIKKGKIIESNDCLIAGIALSNGIKSIVSRNEKHFKRIEGIKVEKY